MKTTKLCKCGKEFEVSIKKIARGRGKFCSMKCKYAFRVMPKRGKGTYVLVKENPTSFKKGSIPWSKGRTDLPPPVNFKITGYGYDALHDWVKRHRGKSVICEKCGSYKTVQWANKSHEYKRDLDDWLSLCRICHIQYDRSNNAWGLATKKFNLQGRCKKQKQPSA